MSAKPVLTLDSVLASVDVRFVEEACSIFFDSVSGVMRQIQDVPNTDKRKHLETCSELFNKGWLSWLEALVELVHGYAEKLAQIVMSYPALVTGDPVKWIRLQLNALLSRHLRQELSIEALAEQALQRRLARREARRSGISSDPAPLESKPGRPHNHSKVGAWLRWVAEDGPDLDRSESGFHEPWLAPAFVDDGLRERMTNDLPDRLTAAQTERVIRRVETRFAGRFGHVLQQVEHKARITLGTNGAVPFPPVDRRQKTLSSVPAAQRSPGVHNEPGSGRIEVIRHKVATHPDGWITNQEAAMLYDCSVKTIREWKRGSAGKLSPGPKRSDVSNRSIINLDNRLASRKAKNKLRSQ